MVGMLPSMVRRNGKPPNYLVILGGRIRDRRKELRLHVLDVWQATGISVTSLGYIERGQNAPSIENIIRLAEILQISISDLLAQLPLPPPKPMT